MILIQCLSEIGEPLKTEKKNKNVKYFSLWMHKYLNAKLKGFSFHHASSLRALFIQSQEYFSTEKNLKPCHKTSAVCKDLFWKASCRHSAMHPQRIYYLQLADSQQILLPSSRWHSAVWKGLLQISWRAKFLQSQQRTWIFTFNFIGL